MQQNKLTFAGFAGKDAEIKHSNGKGAAVFSLAFTKKNKDGQESPPVWLNCYAGGGWANYAAKIKKGDNVLVEGEVNLKTYQAKDGSTQASLNLMVFNILIGQREEKKAEVSDDDIPPF